MTSATMKQRLTESEVATSFVKDLGSIYETALESNSNHTLNEFRAQFDEKENGSKTLDFNPLESKFFDIIQMTGQEFNAMQAEKQEAAGLKQNDRDFYFDYGPPKHHPLKTRRNFEFKLDEKELSILSQHGTVISSKTMSDFGRAYSTLYSNDIPVYLSADSVLHAWHHSFDLMLEELETSVLSFCLQAVLNELMQLCGDKIRRAADEDGDGHDDVLKDVMHFFAVPLALLQNGEVSSSVTDPEIGARVAATLQLVEQGNPDVPVPMFGPKPKSIDFSQFIPRGHYTKSDDLKKYFKAMIWLGRTEFELIKKRPEDVAAAFCVRDLINQSESAKTMVQQISALLTNFIGITDSLTFEDLDKFLSEANDDAFLFGNYDHARDGDRLLQLMAEADLGGQLINSQVRDVTDVEDGIPRAATFLGQKFTLDAWAMCQGVYPADDVRRIPSGVDVAYSVLGNNAAGPILSQRMAKENANPVEFRDGRDVSKHLVSVKQVVDQTPDEFWESSIYGMWVKTLRSLSSSSSSSSGTEAWDVKTMQSQLASWAQLRHDTILYVKQGYTVVCCCEYPDAIVEPNPEFWANLQQMAIRTSELIEGGYPSIALPVPKERDYFAPRLPAHTSELEGSHVNFLQKFSETIGTLRGMAEKQAQNEALSKEDMDFMNRICTLVSIGSGGETDWHGWFPELFYGANMNVTKAPALVADVHTDPPSPNHGNPGCVVHVGVGEIRLCYTARRNYAGEPTLYVGPVMMFYEHLTPYGVRWDDDEWKKQLAAGALSVPDWMQRFVA